MPPPDPEPSDELEALAALVRRLRPDWRDSEGFYELRSEITGALTRLSRRLSGRPAAAPMRITAAPALRSPLAALAPPPHREAVQAAAGPCSALPAARPKGNGRAARRSSRHRYPKPPADPRQASLL
jgi:hypothetical protein